MPTAKWGFAFVCRSVILHESRPEPIAVRGTVKRTIVGINALGVLLCCTWLTAAQQPARSASAAPIAAAHQATLQQYCVTCHNNRLKSGGLAIEQLDLNHLSHDAESWEKVVRKL